MSGTVIYFDLGNTLVFGTGINKQPFSGAVTTIEELWWRGYKIGLLSDQAVGTTEADVRNKLDLYGLDSSRFDVITISSEFNPPVYKPDPAIFDAALAKAGHASASNRTVFVTEDLSHVTAARALGWRSIHKPYGAPCTAASGECVSTMNALLGLFPPLAMDLHIRDAVGDPGDDLYLGPVFWNSPDMWIRHANDGGDVHQSPQAATDNFFHIRVTNRGDGIARQFTVNFSVRQWAGTEFVYPSDWAPVDASVSGANLEPTDVAVLVARWDAADVPPAGIHACWLAAVVVANDLPAVGTHVWEHNNLAQKNLAIVAAPAGGEVELPFVVGSRMIGGERVAELELVRRATTAVTVTLHDRDGTDLSELIEAAQFVAPSTAAPPSRMRSIRFLDSARVEISDSAGRAPMRVDLAAGSYLDTDSRRDPHAPPRELKVRNPANARIVRAHGNEAAELSQPTHVVFAPGRTSSLRLGLHRHELARLNMRFHVPADARVGEETPFEVVQRDADGRVVGGLTVILRVEGREIKLAAKTPAQTADLVDQRRAEEEQPSQTTPSRSTGA